MSAPTQALMAALELVCECAATDLVGLRVPAHVDRDSAARAFAASALAEQWALVPCPADRMLTCGYLTRRIKTPQDGGVRTCVLYTPRAPVDDMTVRFFDDRAQLFSWHLGCEQCVGRGDLDDLVECTHMLVAV